MLRHLLPLAAVCIAGPAAVAQRADAARAAARADAAEPPASGAAPTPSAAAVGPVASRRAPSWAAAVSAVLPGGGQAVRGERRWLVYAAVEGYVWARFAADRRQARAGREDYRAMAAGIARAAFSQAPPVGDWAYYERMEEYVASGAFDLGGGRGLVPERDTLTSNGALWLLARRTYWADPGVAPDTASPAYRAAATFYLAHAIRPEFQWSWAGAPGAMGRYRAAIDQANASYRRASVDVAILVANHLLSAVDAVASLRLERTLDGRALTARIRVPYAPGWRTGLRPGACRGAAAPCPCRRWVVG